MPIGTVTDMMNQYRGFLHRTFKFLSFEKEPHWVPTPDSTIEVWVHGIPYTNEEECFLNDTDPNGTGCAPNTDFEMIVLTCEPPYVVLSYSQHICHDCGDDYSFIYNVFDTCDLREAYLIQYEGHMLRYREIPESA